MTESLNLIVTLVFWSLVAYAATRILLRLINLWLFFKIVELQKDQEEFQKYFVPCRVEKHENIFYIYDVNTGDFIAQGGNMEEIKAHVALTRYRNAQVYVAEGEEDVIQALKLTKTGMEARHA